MNLKIIHAIILRRLRQAGRNRLINAGSQTPSHKGSPSRRLIFNVGLSLLSGCCFFLRRSPSHQFSPSNHHSSAPIRRVNLKAPLGLFYLIKLILLAAFYPYIRILQTVGLRQRPQKRLMLLRLHQVCTAPLF